MCDGCLYDQEFLLNLPLRRTEGVRERIAQAEEIFRAGLNPEQVKVFLKISDLYNEETALSQIATIEFFKSQISSLKDFCGKK